MSKKYGWLVQKKGFVQSAAIFSTKEEAESAARRFFPDIPYRIKRISEKEIKKRLGWYKKRTKR